jgi:hypothetical protein
VWFNAYRKRPENADLRRRERLVAYGLTPETFAARLQGQNHCCIICGETLAPNIGRGCTTHIDHDHRSGGKVPRKGRTVVRGVLDKKCNQGIGYFKDNPALLERAARYLRTSGRFDDWAVGIGTGLLC